MTYPYDGSHHYPTPPSATYGAYWPQFTGTATKRKSLRNQLVWLVLVLGLAAYLISYGLGSGLGRTGWDVRFSMSAAVVAAIGLIARQTAHVQLMAGLAIMGSLEALSRCITGSGGQTLGWAAIVIGAFTALQALAAIAALLAPLEPLSAADRRPAQDDPYAYYAQGAGQHNAAHDQRPQAGGLRASGSAQAEVATPAEPQQSAGDRYGLYTEYLAAQQSNANPTVSSSHARGPIQAARPATSTGLPNTGPLNAVNRKATLRRDRPHSPLDVPGGYE